MGKIIIGFVLGLTATAFAQDIGTTAGKLEKSVRDVAWNTYSTIGGIITAGGLSPSGVYRQILVDEDGRVICSPRR